MTFKWTLLPGPSGFQSRDTMCIFPHKGRHFMWSGWHYLPEPPALLTDLLYANTPGIWTTQAASEPFAPYSVMFSDGNQLVAVSMDAVRTSQDGITWTVLTANSPIANSLGLSDCCRAWRMGNRFYLVTGASLYWETSVGDYVNWTSHPTPWGKRSAFTSIVYDNQLMVMGGASSGANVPPELGYPQMTALQEVWSCANPSDPSTWVSSLAEWDPRLWAAACVHEGELWLTGGFDNEDGNQLNYGDTFQFTFAAGWKRTPIADADQFTPCHGHAMVSDNGRIFLLGGSNNPNGTTSHVFRLDGSSN